MPSDEELDKFLADHPEAHDEFRRLLGSMKPKRPKRKRLRDKVPPRSEESVITPVEFHVPPLPESYTEIEPGTDMWLRFWRANPDKQEEMLEWQKKFGK